MRLTLGGEALEGFHSSHKTMEKGFAMVFGDTRHLCRPAASEVVVAAVTVTGVEPVNLVMRDEDSARDFDRLTEDPGNDFSNHFDRGR